MLYLNQLDHRGVPYRHNVKNGGVPPERQNVATSGCGLCSMCMIVDQLTVTACRSPTARHWPRLRAPTGAWAAI